jgi:hypothetical protein
LKIKIQSPIQESLIPQWDYIMVTDVNQPYGMPKEAMMA